MKRYNVEQKKGETLAQWYKRLAKTADQRLVRLEAAAQESHFHGVKQWSYRSAMNNIRRWSGAAANRFNTKMPERESDVIAKIKDMQSFIESATSTKAGIKEFYVSRTDTVNKRYGTKFTWDQLATYYETEQNDLYDSLFGSKTALMTIGAIQANKDKITAAIKEANEKHIKVSDLNRDNNENFLDLDVKNSLIRDKVYEALDQNGLKIEDLY